MEELVHTKFTYSLYPGSEENVDIFSKYFSLLKSGYVLSKASVRRFVEIGLSSKMDTNLCSKDYDGLEDFEMGKIHISPFHEKNYSF